MSKLVSWAFLIALVLAVILGFMGPADTTWAVVLVIIGLVAGLLNVGSHESEAFLISGAVLIIASSQGGDSVAGVAYLSDILNNILLVFVPATIVVAVRNVFNLARH